MEAYYKVINIPVITVATLLIENENGSYIYIDLHDLNKVY